MRFLGRLLLLIVGLIFAIPAGAVALAIGIAVEPTARALTGYVGMAVVDTLFAEAFEHGAPPLVVEHLVIGFAAVSAALLIAPVTLVALIGEIVGARSIVYYGGLCGLITAAIPWLARGGVTMGPALAAEGRLTALLFVIGAVSGLTYWLIAGRSAGRDPRPKTR